MVVIYDRSGEFVKSYYDPSIDKILNPLDARCAAWDLWKECLTQPDFDNTANTLIPMGTKEDPFWQGSGRTIFAEAAYLMRNDPNRSYSKLVDTLLSIKIEKLRTFLRNSPAATGGRVWGDIPDSSVQPGAGNGEPVTAEVLAQRQAEEAIRRETERRADEIVRKMAENKPDLPDGKTEQAVREIAGQERDRADITEREAALPESVLRESQREQEAVREVARENLLQERLQQIERDMVRDLQKEKTLGGD